MTNTDKNGCRGGNSGLSERLLSYPAQSVLIQFYIYILSCTLYRSCIHHLCRTYCSVNSHSLRTRTCEHSVSEFCTTESRVNIQCSYRIDSVHPLDHHLRHLLPIFIEIHQGLLREVTIVDIPLQD
jgi:hypothetical protein